MVPVLKQHTGQWGRETNSLVINGETPDGLQYNSCWRRQGTVPPCTQADSTLEHLLQNETHALLIASLFLWLAHRSSVTARSLRLQELANHFSKSQRFHSARVGRTFFI